MEALRSPRGLIVDLITPLKTNGSIDGPSLGKLIDRVSPHADALLIASPRGGEGYKLSTARRLELLEKALVVIRGRVPVFFWITGKTEKKTTRIASQLKKTTKSSSYHGHIFCVDTPLYYHSNRGLLLHYRNLVSKIDRPIIIFNDPEMVEALSRPFKRGNIRTAILKSLVSLDHITGMIFLGPLERVFNYQKACKKNPDFRIYDGDEARFMAYPSMGGVVSIGANMEPQLWQKIVSSSLNLDGAQDKYPDSLKRVWEIGDYLGGLKTCYQNMPVPIVKRALAEMGIIATSTCVEQAGNIDEQVNRLRDLMTTK